MSFIFLIFFEFKESGTSSRLMALSAFGIMCLFNSLVYTPACLYILAIYLASNKSRNITLPRLANKAFIAFILFWVVIGIAYNYGYIQTNRIAKTQANTEQNLKKLKMLRPILGNEGYYWSVVALNFYKANRLSDANEAVKRQIERSNNVNGFALSCLIEKKQGNIKKALKIQEKVNSIIPGNIDQKINLFYAYTGTKNSNKAKYVGSEIAALCENVSSKTCSDFLVENTLMK